MSAIFLTYRQLQVSLKMFRTDGIVLTCKLNCKDEVLRLEYHRITRVQANKPAKPERTPSKVAVLRSEPIPVIVKAQPTHNVVLKGYEPSPVGYVPLKRYAYSKEDMPNRLAPEPKPYKRVTDVAWIG